VPDQTHGPIGLVVVTYSPGDTLAALLDSVPKATSRQVEVVLADNGSTDGSVEAAAERDGVRLVRTGGNLGYGGAANVGAQVLDATLQAILVINPDVVLDPGSIDTLLAALDRLPGAGSVGPLIVDQHGTVYPSARRLPTVGTGIGHAMFGWWWPSNPWTVAYRLDHAEPVERPAGWLSGSCLLVRRTAWDSVGGFDPAYFMYFEDVDLGGRLQQAGWQNVYVPSARVVHIGGHAAEREPAAMARAHHESAYRYLAGRYPRWWQAPLRLTFRGGLAARAFAAKRSAKVAGGAALPERHA
jgi:N-acetylglucosaminyl-diphospho-decaprenol L-rhamnosyltransferase